jgi:hypothetical protein
LDERNRGWSGRVARRRLSGLGILVLIAGCHGRQQSRDTTLLGRISRGGHSTVQAPKPGDLAEKGRAEITDECAKQSYKTARKGLIVSETALHEDVFTLRDRVSYGAVGYRLDDALRLEALLRVEAKSERHPAEQANCIEEFAEHLESVSDPLVEGDERLKELDASAFEDSAKEAQQLTERQLRAAEKRAKSKESPQNY